MEGNQKEEFGCPKCGKMVEENTDCDSCGQELIWEEIEVEKDNEFENILERMKRFFITWHHSRIIIKIKTYERFMTMGENWVDAFMLYCYYFYTARNRKTNELWINQAYCMEGLKWPHARVDKAKKILKDNGLIETKMETNDKGHRTKSYVVMKYLPRAQIFEDFTRKVKKRD